MWTEVTDIVKHVCACKLMSMQVKWCHACQLLSLHVKCQCISTEVTNVSECQLISTDISTCYAIRVLYHFKHYFTVVPAVEQFGLPQWATHTVSTALASQSIGRNEHESTGLHPIAVRYASRTHIWFAAPICIPTQERPAHACTSPKTTLKSNGYAKPQQSTHQRPEQTRAALSTLQWLSSPLHRGRMQLTLICMSQQGWASREPLVFNDLLGATSHYMLISWLPPHMALRHHNFTTHTIHSDTTIVMCH